MKKYEVYYKYKDAINNVVSETFKIKANSSIEAQGFVAAMLGKCWVQFIRVKQMENDTEKVLTGEEYTKAFNEQFNDPLKELRKLRFKDFGCNVCNKKAVYISDYNGYCEECGQVELKYIEEIDGYIREDIEFHKLLDDDLADLEIFKYVGDNNG